MPGVDFIVDDEKVKDAAVAAAQWVKSGPEIRSIKVEFYRHKFETRPQQKVVGMGLDQLQMAPLVTDESLLRLFTNLEKF